MCGVCRLVRHAPGRRKPEIRFAVVIYPNGNLMQEIAGKVILIVDTMHAVCGVVVTCYGEQVRRDGNA